MGGIIISKILTSIFRGKFFEDFYNMHWAQKLIVRRYVVSRSTTKSQISYQLSRSPYRGELTTNFLQKNGPNFSLWMLKIWAHFVRRYLKHAVSSEAVTVAVASMQ